MSKLSEMYVEQKGEVSNGYAHRSRPKRLSLQPEFSNYRVCGSGEDSTKVGLPAGTIANNLLTLTDNWPKRIGREGTRLFALDDDGKPLWLETTESLFAWISRQLSDGETIRWVSGEDKLSRGDFNAYLRQTVERYDAIESAPHYPPLANCYYAHPKPTGGDGKTLQALLEKFTPATLVDFDLIKAAILTLFWGGPPGQRPAFLIESEDDDSQGGRGVGKSKLTMALAHLAGGHIDARPGEDIDKLMTRILSPVSLDRRVALLDNVKTLRFSWSDLEALITTDVISGRQLYVGEGRRPNTLVWFITLNSASLSRDMAQRCIVIRLKRPPHDPVWEERVWGFINNHRWEIIGDIIAELRRPAATLTRYSRWSAWEQAVLSRVAEPSDCQKVIGERQDAIDDDRAEADLVRQAFIAELQRRGHDPETDAIWIETKVVADVVNTATGEKWPSNRASKYVGTLAIRELRKSDYHGIRGWAWRGIESDNSAKLMDLRQNLHDSTDPWTRGHR